MSHLRRLVVAFVVLIAPLTVGSLSGVYGDVTRAHAVMEEPALQHTGGSPTVMVFLVDGNGDCCMNGATKLIDGLKALSGTDVDIRFAGLDARKLQPKTYDDRSIPWNSLYNRHEHGFDIGNNMMRGTNNFIQDIQGYLAELPAGTGLVFVGHSFGGDSILSFLQIWHRTKHPILFVGVIDPVDGAGLRNTLRSKEVGDNVRYFYNRWQTNEPWPLDFLSSGSIRCSANQCDQAENSKHRNWDGSHERVQCGELEIGCHGARTTWEMKCTGPKWARVCTKLPGYDPGTKRKPVSHQSLPEDAYVQRQMLEIISTQIGRFVRESAKTQPTAVSPPQIVVADPTTEAAQQIAASARRGDIAAATDTIIEAEASMALILPGRTFAEVCWYGALHGKANQVLTLCDEAVHRLPNDADARDKRGLARALTGNLIGAVEDFRFFVQKLEPQIITEGYAQTNEAAERVRIRRVWIQQLEAGRFPFNASVVDDLWKVEGESPWVSSESGQIYYASGSARPRTVTYEAPLPSTQPQEPATATAGSASQPGGGAGTGNQPPMSAPAAIVTQVTLITDFEQWGAWRRGDEPWGTFSQSAEQRRSGNFSGKIAYSFPSNEPNNYVVFLRTLPIAGQPDALRAQVYGDGSTHFLNAWLQDAKGQTWQFTFGRINHTGWQEMVAPLDLSLGWPNQAIGATSSAAPTFPVKLSALVLDGHTSEQAFQGSIYLDDLEAISYQEAAPAGSAPSGGSAGNPAPTQERATIAAASLNVRSGPGTAYGVIAKVQQGESYPVLARDAATGWLQIALAAAPAGSGWVSGQHVRVSTSAAAQAPATAGGAGAATSANTPQPPASPATGSAVPAGGPAAAVSAPAGQAALVTDFETWGTWQRGDETWGTFTQSTDQKQSGRYAGKFEYSFPAGEPSNYIVFRRTIPIAGQPAALRLKVLGDGSTHFLNAWVQDAKGQTWQFSFGRINHQGWQAMEAPLDPSLGWPNQAIDHSATSIAYPIKLYALVLDGFTSDQAFDGVVYVDDLEAVAR